ncbi:TetR/AcrR family transcriptional regulator [Mycetocola zhadangensis]|uniref:TetR/AcrR family transcriptional regulator n=1 Tax=Mycetocola zhadangensis TaxID=1164595 RepID=UPI003A4DA7AF
MSSEPRSQSTPQSRILSAASAVFAERGFNGGSLTDIATGAEMTRPGVLHHYPSKQAVLLALLDRRDQELQQLLPDTASWDLVEFLEYFERASVVILSNRELVQLAHALTAEAAAPDHPARPWVVKRHRRLRADFVRAIENSKRVGTVPAEFDSAALAGAMLGAIEGIENQWLVDREFDAAAAIRMHIQLVLQAVARKRK